MDIQNVEERNGTLKFSAHNVDLPIINGIRRSILSDITVVGIKGFPEEDCDINIIKNDTHLHNEMLKQRIMSIPVYLFKPDSKMFKTLKFVLNVKNDTETIMPVTTEHIEIMDTTTNKLLDNKVTKKIFPADTTTGEYILLAWLKPTNKSLKSINKLHFEGKFSVVSPNVNSVYNCVSKVSFSNKIDVEKQEIAWLEKQKQLPEDCNVEAEKENWRLLHGQREYVENTYDFVIKSIGFYSNKVIIEKACNNIVSRLRMFTMENDTYFEIKASKQSNIPNSYDIVLKNESYTIGNILKKYIYKMFYKKTIHYVGFDQQHPHDSYSIIRIGFINAVDDMQVFKTLKESSEYSIEMVNQFKELVSSSV